MTPHVHDEWPAVWVDGTGIALRLRDLGEFFRDTLVIAELEVRKLRHDPTELVTRAVQPALWLVVFGEVFGRLRAIPTGSLPYLDFLTPGILAQSVLFIAIFYGIAVIWERDLGIVHKLLASPAPRTALVLGKALSAGVRGLAQGVLVLILAWALGVHLRPDPAALLAALLVVLLGAALFATFSLIIACLVKTRERFMGIGQVLTMPLFFASNAIYPVAMMPRWLQAVAYANPLSYQVDALRRLLVGGDTGAFGLGVDLAALVVGVVALTAIASRLYPRVAE